MAAKLANISVGQFSGNQHVPSANLQTPPVSQADAAKLLNVSTRSVAAAAKVIHEGSEDLIDAVERGETACGRPSLMVQVASLLRQIFLAQAGLVGTKEPDHDHRAEEDDNP